jgi:pimeloyl-ACP methyl ester carboxylesterase
MKTRQVKCVLIVCIALGFLSWTLSAAGQIPKQGAVALPAATAEPQSAPATPVATDHSTITGEWQGAITRLRLVIKIDQGPDGPLKGTLTSVDQGNVTLPVDTVSLDAGGTLRLELKGIGAVYEGKLNGGEITGTWQQGGNTLPLVLRRPGAAAAAFTLKPRTLGRVSLSPCRTPDGNTEGLCGKYEVYENRQSQQGRKIALNIMVLPAAAEKPAPDAFFPLAGGPGQSAVDAFPLTGYTAKIRQQRDVVLVDQRGTGGSNQLQCEARDLKNAQTVLGDPFPAEKLAACRTELEKRADLTQYTTSISSDDLDEVRAAMGYDKIDVFGGSYGSRAALDYVRRHGDHVRSLALEAVASTQYRIPLAFAKTIQNSVDQLITRCAADADCDKEFPLLRSEFNGLLEKLEKSPAHFEVSNREADGALQPVTLSRGMFVASLRPLLYVPVFASQFPSMIHHASRDDWQPYANEMLTLAKALDKQISSGMTLAVVCSEDVSQISEPEIKRETAGSYLGDFSVRVFQKACEGWPRATIAKDFYAPVRSSVPTLLIAGALDPATPPETAAQAAQELKNSRTIVVKEGTHGTGSPCIDGIVTQFVKQGSPAGLDESCVGQIHLPPFVAKMTAQPTEQAGKQ